MMLASLFFSRILITIIIYKKFITLMSIQRISKKFDTRFDT